MNISEFLPEVYLEAQGCPESVAINALRNTLRELCEQSKIWQEDLDSISPISGYQTYDIDVPVDSELSVLFQPLYNGQEMKLYSPAEMDRKVSTWRTDTGAGVTYVIQDWNKLHVYPIPTADDDNAIYLRAALKPTLVGTTCSNILSNFSEGISAGAIARLKAIPNKPWTDREGIPYYASLFAASIRKAQVMALKGFSVRDTKIIPRNYV